MSDQNPPQTVDNDAPRAQRYTQPTARERMSHGLCPECGGPPATHSNDLRFWMPRACDLTAQGVAYEWDTRVIPPASTDRIGGAR